MKRKTESDSAHGITRRTAVKSAAWAMPVIAAAVATPLAAASTPAPFAMTVRSDWDGNYLDDDLRTMVRSYVDSFTATEMEVNFLDLLAAWGLHRDAWVEMFPPNVPISEVTHSVYHQLTRSFTFGATSGAIPAGAVFQLSYPVGALNTTTLTSLLTTAIRDTGLALGDVTDTAASLIVGPAGLTTQLTVNLAAAWNLGVTRRSGAVVMSYSGAAAASGTTTASLSAVVTPVSVRLLFTNVASTPGVWIDSVLERKLEEVITRVHGTINVQVSPGGIPLPLD